MKKSVIALLLLLFIKALAINAQSKDTLTISTFTGEQWEQWNKIEKEWSTTKFHPFLKKHKLKNSCAHCYSIHFEVLFFIDSIGKNSPLLISTYACGKTFTEKQKTEILALLSDIVFPLTFRNLYLKMRIGSTLKC